MEKKRVSLSFGKITPEINSEIVKQYPFGIENALIDLNLPNMPNAKALLVETNEAMFLVRFTKKDLEELYAGWDEDEDEDNDSFPMSADDTFEEDSFDNY